MLQGNYTLHLKILEYTISALDYNSCYTFHFIVNFVIILDDIT